MDRGTLIKDLAIIAIMLVAGTLTYLAFGGINDPLSDTQSQTGEHVAVDTSTSTTNDLKIEVIKEGTGNKEASNGSVVSVHYRGRLENGTVFDSSYDRGEPLRFKLGAGEVIPGWEIGILGMKVGEKRVLTIPPELAYGEEGIPPVIPPNATLIFDVDLVAVE